MTEPPAPPRLKRGKDVPPELRRALRALGNQDTHHRRLGRVAEKLGPLLDAPPPTPPSLLHARHLAQGFAAKVVVALLAIGASGIGLVGLFSQQEESPETTVSQPLPRDIAKPQLAVRAATRPAGSRPAVPAVDEGARLDPAPSPAPLIEAPNVERDGVEREVPMPRVGRVAKRPRVRASSPRAASRSTPDSTTPGLTTDRIAAGSAPGRAGSLAPTGSEIGEATPDSAASPTAAQPDSARVFPARGEVELLVEARKLMVRDPAAALHVLHEHEARFADGMLVPEREVLAVEVLRRLGETAAAEQRLRGFRARYPGSLHLQRLDRDVR